MIREERSVLSCTVINKIVLFVLLITICSLAQAQIYSSIEIGMGLNSGIEPESSLLSKQDILSVSDNSFKGSLKAYYLSKINLYFGTGLSYSTTNFNTPFETRSFATIGVPVYLGYKISANRFGIFADAGIEFKIAEKIGYLYIYEGKRSIIGNIGCEYKISRTIYPFVGIHIENGRYSMDNFVNNPSFYGFSVGIRIRY